MVGYLTRDKDFSEEQAVLMMRLVESRDYNPPKRERILEWQAQQEFPILAGLEDLGCGNLYGNLMFPEAVYEHIGQYQEDVLRGRRESDSSADAEYDSSRDKVLNI